MGVTRTQMGWEWLLGQHTTFLYEINNPKLDYRTN